MAADVRLYLVDGTYELFRAYFAMPSAHAPNGQPTGAVRGLVQTLLSLLRRDQPTHISPALSTTSSSPSETGCSLATRRGRVRLRSFWGSLS